MYRNTYWHVADWQGKSLKLFLNKEKGGWTVENEEKVDDEETLKHYKRDCSRR